MFILFLFFLSFLSSQEIPSNYLLNDSIKYNIDEGINWNAHSTLDQINYIKFTDSQLGIDDISMISDIGLELGTNNYFFLNNVITFKKFFYLDAKFKASNSSNDLLGYTALPRDVKRLGYFNSGEYEYASIGYNDKYFLYQFGRGRQVWGAGDGINLILNEYSPTYDYLLLGLDLEKYRLRYFHGYLESIGHIDPINRYIAGRAIERTNFNNFIISIAEVIIYHGENRPVDFSILNPIGLHTEVELNGRQNFSGNKQNAVWQFSLDRIFLKKLRFSFNFLIDELTLDEQELKKGETQLTAFSAKINYFIGDIYKYKTFFDISLEQVGSFTYKHQYGMNNFVSRNLPLGNLNGSDFKKINIGFSFIKNPSTKLRISFSKLIKGENDIYSGPYTPYENIYKVSFPSGRKETILNPNISFNHWIGKNMNFMLSYSSYHGNSKNQSINVSFLYYLTFKEAIINDKISE